MSSSPSAFRLTLIAVLCASLGACSVPTSQDSTAVLPGNGAASSGAAASPTLATPATPPATTSANPRPMAPAPAVVMSEAPPPPPADRARQARESAAQKSLGDMSTRNMVMGGMPAQAPMALPAREEREVYQAIADNPVQQVAQAPVSTFSVDVDTGAYANVRRMLNTGRLPPTDAVRVEEMINYFPYDYARPTGNTPFAVHTEVARAPWNPKHLLMRVAVKGQDMAHETLPPANLVFLVDVSGSMMPAERLPLLKSSLKLLVDQLRPQDRVSLVTYASGTSVVLEAAPGSDKARILNAIDALQAGGSTAGASGIELAYRMARQGFVSGGINRILLATDGDFNVGVTDFRQLKQMVEERRKSGVSLSTLGFGTGNYNERLMEQLADAGDGAYSYVDNLMEGHKVLVTEMTSTLATIARDVKIQVEFNPAAVSEYRLIGYENRMLAREDFNNDKVDAGDIGAGHTVTALYELTPVGERGQIDPLRYGSAGGRSAQIGNGTGTGTGAEAASSSRPAGELAFVKLRYKPVVASADTSVPSKLIEQPVSMRDVRDLAQADSEFRFATAIAGFGQVLRGGKYTGDWSIKQARELAAGSLGSDRFGYRAESLRLMDLAGSLSSRAPLASR